MDKNSGVTVIIPAYNEEKNISAAVKNASEVLEEAKSDYEILIYDDGSTDTTGQVIRNLLRSQRRITVITNPMNLGLGHIFRDAIRQATKAYLTVFPGDNDMSKDSLFALLQEKRKNSLIISSVTSQVQRKLSRRILSRLYVVLLNALFRLNVKYYNGPFICPVKPLRLLPLYSNGFAIFAELKIRLIKGGYRYKEIPFTHIGRKYGQSKAIRLRNILDVLITIVQLMRTNFSHVNA